MFALRKSHPRNPAEAAAKLAALDRVQGVIEFDMTGRILAANPTFLAVMGYDLRDVVGQHHGIFVDPDQRDSAGYRAFWNALRAGEVQAAQFRRLAKGGREVWIEASYTPLIGGDGRPYKVVKFATDITRRKAEDADRAGQIAAIGTSQAVIAFDLDGTVLDANANFLAVVGYGLEEVKGRHHSLFVEPSYRESEAYRAFWAGLRQGTYQAGQYRRLGRGGREVWIQATYNPILDASGRPYKVVKFATDVTDQIRLLTDLRTLIDTNFSGIDRAVACSTDASEAAQGAVVAQEVKSLANQAARATEQINGEIVRVQTISHEVVGVLAEMRGSVGVMRDHVIHTAAAVEEQSAVTRDMSRNMQEAADAVAAISGNIGAITAAVSEVSGAVGTTREAAQVLAR